MKTVKIFTITLLLILAGCSSVKNDTTNYRLKDNILYYKNDEIGHVRECKSKENDQDVEKKYTVVLDENINKNVISKEDVVNYFLKKYSVDNAEVEVYTTLVK